MALLSARTTSQLCDSALSCIVISCVLLVGVWSQTSATCTVEILRGCSNITTNTSEADNECCSALQNPQWRMEVGIWGTDDILRRDSFSLYPEEFIAAKRDFVTTLSSLLTEKASIHQDANVSQLKVTKALDKILEKIKEDACAWLLHSLDTREGMTCSEILYQSAAEDSAIGLLRHLMLQKTGAIFGINSVWVPHWQEKSLCREVAQRMNLNVDYSQMQPCSAV